MTGQNMSKHVMTWSCSIGWVTATPALSHPSLPDPSSSAAQIPIQPHIPIPIPISSLIGTHHFLGPHPYWPFCS